MSETFELRSPSGAIVYIRDLTRVGLLKSRGYSVVAGPIEEPATAEPTPPAEPTPEGFHEITRADAALPSAADSPTVKRPRGRPKKAG